jgi:hypothetical protein
VIAALQAVVTACWFANRTRLSSPEETITIGKDMGMNKLSRRECLKVAAASMAASAALPVSAQEPDREARPAKAKPVAAVITVYRPGSHADVLIGKILEGWKQDGGAGPALKLASMYVDQFPEEDLARRMSRKHGVPLFDSIEKALTAGTDRIAVEGVISIGEHGDYPWNDKEQHLYPRRRFFEEITAAFEKYGKVVPVFSDKHLGPAWSDAQWMYDRARKLKVPFMAGSSLPVSFRSPAIDVPMNCELEAAVGIGYDGLDIYGSHALDCYQCLVEHRRGAEKGVKWVQFLQGEAVWKAVADGLVPESLLDAALAIIPKVDGADPRKDEQATLFLFEHTDGFRGAQFMLQSVSRTAAAVQIKGQPKPLATSFEERPEPHYPHFAYLLKAIETMIHTGRPAYPVERVLLTSGILDRVLTSRAEGGKRLETPELAISYRPVDYPHAPDPDLLAPPPR